MAGILDFIFGKGALNKAGGTAAPAATAGLAAAPQPNADSSGLQLAAQAQKQANIARGSNDASIGSRSVSAPVQPNDAAIKAKVAAMPIVKPQGNDVGLK